MATLPVRHSSTILSRRSVPAPGRFHAFRVPALALLLSLPVTAQTTVPIDPHGTYLRTEGDPGAQSALALDLASIGVQPGDILSVRVLGEFGFGTDPADTSTALLGVFSSGDTLLPAGDHRVPGAIDAGWDTMTVPTLVGNHATDIPEDFSIPPTGLRVRVPPGATHLFVAAHDSFYGDNSDADADFAMQIRASSPPATAPLLLFPTPAPLPVVQIITLSRTGPVRSGAREGRGKDRLSTESAFSRPFEVGGPSANA